MLLGDLDGYVKLSEVSNPYGDGLASKRIADILEGRPVTDFYGI